MTWGVLGAAVLLVAAAGVASLLHAQKQREEAEREQVPLERRRQPGEGPVKRGFHRQGFGVWGLA